LIIHTRGYGSLNQDGAGGKSEKWSNSRYVLKIEPTGFSDVQIKEVRKIEE
jgi:hypothetical protein